MWISNIKAYEGALKYGKNMGNLHVNEFNIQWKKGIYLLNVNPSLWSKLGNWRTVKCDILLWYKLRLLS